MDPLDARADLSRIRSLMERARDYRHLPAPAAFTAGLAAVAAGNFARAAVRALGLAFLAAGIAQLARPVAPEVAVGASFGLFHLAFGAVLALRPASRT